MKNIKDILIFCKGYSESTAENWGKAIFSDETAFRLFEASGKMIVCRGKTECYHQSCVVPTVKHPETMCGVASFCLCHSKSFWPQLYRASAVAFSMCQAVMQLCRLDFYPATFPRELNLSRGWLLIHVYLHISGFNDVWTFSIPVKWCWPLWSRQQEPLQGREPACQLWCAPSPATKNGYAN